MLLTIFKGFTDRSTFEAEISSQCGLVQLFKLPLMTTLRVTQSFDETFVKSAETSVKLSSIQLVL